MGILEWLLLLLLLLFAGTRQNVSEPIMIDNENAHSIENITAYGEQFIQTDEGWYVLQTANTTSISVAWTDDEAVIHVFDYSTAIFDPKRVFAADWIEGSLSVGYDNVEFDQQCEQDNVYLFDFDLEYDDIAYRSRAWVFYDDADYIRNVIFVFPAARADEIDAYGEQFFPEFYSCDQ